MDIARMLGSVVLPLGDVALSVGMVVHFMMGMVFAIICALVWLGLGMEPVWWTGLIFGAVHFLVAVAGMAMMMPMHKEVRAGRLPNPLSGGPMGMMGMLLGHLLFSQVVALVYRPFLV